MNFRFSLLLAAAIALGSAWAQSTNLITNPGFETDGGWLTGLRYGGEGIAIINDMLACGGTRSMKLTKTNAVGAVILQSAPVKLQPNVHYTCRFRFHAENATLANILLLRISTGKDDVLAYNSIDASAGWMSQSLLINSPRDQWEKRVVHYQTDQPREVYVNVVLYGNPCSVSVDDFEFVPDDYKITPVTSEFRDACTAEQLPGLLAVRPDATGQVVVQDGRSTLLMNGKPTPPVIYKGEPYHVESDLKRFGEAGINLATVSVRLGSIKGDPGVWLGKDKYDFTVAEQKLQKALLRNPQAVVVLDLWFYPYPDWGKENPGECWTNEEGKRGYGTWGNLDGFTDDVTKLPAGRTEPWWYPSYNSEKWRQDSAAAAAALINHLRQTPYGKAIGGYFLSGGHDGQFQVFGDFDYSEGSRQRFAQWLQQKYGTIEKLREVWGQATPATFAEVKIPATPAKSGNMEALAPYLDPGPALDYRDFATNEAWQLRDHYSTTVKQTAGKSVFTIAYGDPAVYDFSPLLGLKSLDASASMSYYPYRNAGYAAGYRPFNSYPLHGKLFFQEIDTRSWAGSVHADEVYQMWIGAGLNPAQWRAINRKLSGFSLANGTGYWWYDMNHFFDAPEIMADIAKQYAETARLRSRPPSQWRPDVCVVEAGGQAKYLSSDFSSVNSSHFYELMALEQSGVPFDLHYLDDVLARPELQRYKMYVFYQTRYLKQAQRQAIAQKLQRGGKTLVWMHDDGYLSEQGKSAAAQSDLMGIKVKTEEKYQRLTPVALAEDPITKGIQPFLGLNEMMLTIMVMEGQSSFGTRTQQFWVDDPQATPLARYAEDGGVAGAMKSLKGWNSVYLASANSLTGDLLHNLAQRARAYTCGPAGQSIAMNGRFLSLHGLHDGEYTLTLPPGAQKLREVDSGKYLPVVKGQCHLAVRAQETYWFEFE